MNYKIAKTMLVLCVVYLIGFYILKFIFPELLLQTITSPTMLKLGEFVNSWIGFSIILEVLGATFTMYLFVCASCGRYKYSKNEILYCSIVLIIDIIVYYFLPELYTHTITASFFICSCICKGNIIYTTISFTIHGFLSQFLLSIRGFETIIPQIAKIGILSGLILSLEANVWLTLLSIIFYYKENKNGFDLSPVHQ